MKLPNNDRCGDEDLDENDENVYVVAVIAQESGDWLGGEREWRLVDVDDGVTVGRDLHYRDCPPPVNGPWLWLFAASVNSDTATIADAMAHMMEIR